MFLIILILLLHLFAIDYLMSVWLLSSPYGRSDSWCVSVCISLLPACACAVRVCVSPLLWITSVYALHVCVLCVKLGLRSWYVSLIVRVCVCVRVWLLLLQLSICTTPGIAMVYYYVLMHGPYGKVCVSVWYDCACLCACEQTLSLRCGSCWCSARLTGDVAHCTHCTFPVVDFWYYLVSLECTCL